MSTQIGERESTTPPRACISCGVPRNPTRPLLFVPEAGVVEHLSVDHPYDSELPICEPCAEALSRTLAEPVRPPRDIREEERYEEAKRRRQIASYFRRS